MKKTIAILGMMCAGCSARVEQRLNALDGVASASVSLPSRTALVDYDPGIITLEQMKADLDTPEAQAAMERLPETAERLRVLLKTLEDNKELFTDLQKLDDANVTNGLQTVLGVTQKYAQLDSLNAARQQNLAGRMRAWLDFGEEYDIFTQRTNAMTSSVSFIYKLQSIG